MRRGGRELRSFYEVTANFIQHITSQHNLVQAIHGEKAVTMRKEMREWSAKFPYNEEAVGLLWEDFMKVDAVVSLFAFPSHTTPIPSLLD